MMSEYTYPSTLAASERVRWRVEDLIGGERRLDFSKPFLPESLARVEGLGFLDAAERRTLNQVRGHTYLYVFGLVEEFILPFVLDHARPQLHGDDYRVRALLQFASEEAKHIHLFKRFREEFLAGFGTDCDVIGPAHEVAREVLSHHPLAVALAILQIEWMTQRHYVEGVRDNAGIDPLFKSLLTHHWMEEAQHAKLDTLMVEALAEACTPAEIDTAIAEYAKIGAFLDAGLLRQVDFDLDAFERAAGRAFAKGERDELQSVQRQATRWTFLGSGMTHPKFLATVEALRPAARRKIEAMAPVVQLSAGARPRTATHRIPWTQVPRASVMRRPIMSTATQIPVHRINGIDVQALGEVVREVQADPSKGVVAFRVTSAWKGQTKSESVVESYSIGGREVPRRFKIVADEPFELLGTNTAPNPQELLMSALNACMMVGYVAGAAVHGIALEKLEIETRGSLDLRGFLGVDPNVPAGYEAIRYEVRIKGNGTPEQFAEIHRNVIATSPNYFNVSRPIRLEAELKVEA